jgi:hypothetical protein
MTKTDKPPLIGEKFIGITDIYESIGSLIVQWSSVEQALKKSIDGLRCEGMPEAKIHTISQTLNHWKDLQFEVSGERPEHKEFVDAIHSELVEALNIRNCICHGAVALETNMTMDEDEAHIVTQLNGGERILSLAELKSTIQFLFKTYVRMGDITNVAKQPNSAELSDDYARLRIQFGLS